MEGATNNKLGKIVKKSSLYNVKAWGKTDQADFLNAVCLVETNKTPQDVLQILIEIEQENGRERLIKWGPRTLDLDLLLYDDLILETEDLIIPHPFMHQRDFVLIPLAEISPLTMHPVLKKNILELKTILE